MKKKALILGVSGQDGSYLAELLLEKGYEVHGVIRRSSSPNTGRIDHIFDKLNLHYGDVTDPVVISRLISKIQPDEIYNLSAQSHVRVSFDIPYYTAQVDALGTLNILEAIRAHCPTSKFYQASTSELFGKVAEIPQNENTPFYPRSPYGAAKIYGFWITKNYREAYDLFACNGILFNHECISENTPLILKEKKTNLILIKRIKDIRKQREKTSKEQWKIKDLQIWDGDNFVNINYITSTKKTKKNECEDFECKTINTRHGVVEVTNHHNMLSKDEAKIKAKSVNIGTKLLHKEFPQNTKSTSVDKDVAMFMGMMAGDGYISEDGKGQFTNINERYIEKITELWNKIACGYTTSKKYSKTEKTFGCATQTMLNGNSSYLKYLRQQLYTNDGFKKVPDIIINSKKEIMNSFLVGYNYSDGLKSRNLNYEFQNFKTNSSLLALGLIFLISNTTKQDFNVTFEEDKKYYGYYSINLLSPNKKKEKINDIKKCLEDNISANKICKLLNTTKSTIKKIKEGESVFCKSYLKKDRDEVNKTLYHRDQPQSVYDIETDSGKFMAGVGRIVISNSPRRGITFVTRKITSELVRIKYGDKDVLKLGNLDAKRDWGHAKEFVEGMWRMLQQDSPDDFVLATGELHSVRDCIEIATKELGYEIEWKGEGIDEKGYDKKTGKLLIEIDEKYFRPSEVDLLLGDPSKAKKELGWEAKIKFEELIKEIVKSDIEQFKTKGKIE